MRGLALRCGCRIVPGRLRWCADARRILAGMSEIAATGNRPLMGLSLSVLDAHFAESGIRPGQVGAAVQLFGGKRRFALEAARSFELH